MTAFLLIIMVMAAGIILGMRFRVFILIPCFMLLAAGALGAGPFLGFGLFTVLGGLALAMAALQFGFLVGAALVLALAALRAPRLSRLRARGVGSSSPLGS